MSEFHVEVCALTNVRRHPDPETTSLSVGEVNGYPVVFRTGDYQEGDHVVHIPVDSICPVDDPRFDFLGKRNTIRPKRLRGVFSLGLIIPADPSWEVGRDCQADLRIERFDPDAYGDRGTRKGGLPGGSFKSGPKVSGPQIPIYDIEGFRKYQRVLEVGEEVQASEKIHGANGRWIHDGERLHVGSRKEWKDQSDTADLWVRVAQKYDLASKCAQIHGIALYGEVHGQVQDLKYGAGPNEVRLALFDAYNTTTNTWLDVDDFLALCKRLDLPTVCTLYRGPWDPALVDLCEGPSTMDGASHTREGFVVRPVRERQHPRLGRVILKMVGQGYHLRADHRALKEAEPEIQSAIARAQATVELLTAQPPVLSC